jgi:hypothetical protein
MIRAVAEALARQATEIAVLAGLLIAAGSSAEAGVLTAPAATLQLSPAWFFGVAIVPPMLLLATGFLMSVVLDLWRRD